ncbi:MAG: hypothetical protein QOG71_2329 [Pyrinomonadaceae bacterium]|nr:hypothetical protein [Pyrinomonadaceae bacterium]
MKDESFKAEIVKALKVEGRFTKIIQHPTFLLILGFALTGIVGSWLTTSWQSREWNRQQTRLSQQKAQDLKYGLIEEATKGITENQAALDNLAVEALLISEKVSSPQDFEEKFDAWKLVNGKLRYNFQITEQKINIYFSSPRIQPLLEEISGYNTGAELSVKLFYSDYKRDVNILYDSKKFDDHIKGITNRRKRIDELLKQLINEMQEEIKRAS